MMLARIVSVHSKRCAGVKFLNRPLRSISGFLSEKDFLDATTTTAVATATTAVAAAAPVAMVQKEYQAIRLGVQLAKYGVNITKMAADGQLEKVIGRDEEIQQAIQILSRRRKNNPCLVGEPGVGRSLHLSFYSIYT